MTYTINGKDYTEFDINKRCAEILYPDSEVVRSIVGENMVTVEGMGFAKIMISYYNNPTDTWPIIEKCWDRLLNVRISYDSINRMVTGLEWESIMIEHNCSKLVAACICFIEVNNDNT
jgi:hypothetical protein